MPTAPTLRAALRLTGAAAWILLVVLAWTVGTVALAAVPTARRAFRRRVVAAWAAGLLHALRVRVDQHGRPPARPFLLVSNHLGYLDIAVLAATTGGCVFVSNHEVAEWPVWGPLSRMGGTIFVDRSRPRDALRVLGRMRKALERGEGVVVFPEGTSSGGAAVLPLRSALLAGAAREGIPVHWAVLSYRTPPGSPPASEAVCWWGRMTFVPHVVGLARLPRIDATLVWGDEAVVGDDRKALAVRLHGLLSARLPEEGAPPVAGATEGAAS